MLIMLKLFFTACITKSRQIPITMTCALKNWCVNLPAWLARYGRMTQKVGGVYNFSSLYGYLCFWVNAIKRRRDDGRIAGIRYKKVYFAMKIQISRLSARCHSWYGPGTITDGPPPCVNVFCLPTI